MTPAEVDAARRHAEWVLHAVATDPQDFTADQRDALIHMAARVLAVGAEVDRLREALARIERLRQAIR